jgi:hypothetical protein
MRGEGAPRLRDDVRHRETLLPTRFADRVDDVVGVLLQRVVDAGDDGGARAVVVDAQSTADIDVRDVHAESAQLGVEPRNFRQTCLDVADIGDLRAEVEVDQAQNVEAAKRGELVDHLHQLAGREPELRLLSAALRPAPESFRRQLDANARRGLDAERVRGLEQHVELGQLLDDDEHLMPELLTHQSQTHELGVLVAVADNEVIRAFPEREHGLQLGLAAALQPNAVRRAELHDLLDDVPLLVDLDRVDRRVAALVSELLDRGAELLAQRLDARAKDFGEAQQERQPDTLLLEIHRELEEIELPFGVSLVRPHDDMAVRADVEVAEPPAFNVVEPAGILDRPASRRRGHRRALGDSCGHDANSSGVP